MHERRSSAPERPRFKDVRLVVLLNMEGGSVRHAKPDEPARTIASLFAGHGLDVEIVPVRGDGLLAAARAAASRTDVQGVVAAGGDGTLGTVAEALAGTGMPMGVLPLGTRNHFARDLGVPLSLPRAVALIAAGGVREVDVGEVNGRVFLNNSSIGLYPRIVEVRAGHRWRRRAGKMLAFVRATIRVTRKVPHMRVLLAGGAKRLTRTTPFVFVANNDYAFGGFTARRPRLDAGTLALYLTDRTTRLGLLKLAYRAIRGTLGKRVGRELETVRLEEVWVDPGKRIVRVATDGEIHRLVAPLHYRIRKRALPVFAPPLPAEAPA